MMQDFLKLPGNSNLSIPLDTPITQNAPETSLSISYKAADFARIRKPSGSEKTLDSTKFTPG